MLETDYTDRFRINESFIYLNNCGVGATPDAVTSDINEFMNEYSRLGIYAEKYSFTNVKKSITENLLKLFNCREDEITLIHNTSEGMNFVSHGLDFSEDSEILLLKDEYPSNVYPWQHLQKNGVKLRFLEHENIEDFNTFFAANLRPETALVSLPAVHWLTGRSFDLKTISELCRKNGTYLCIDAAQGAGLVDIDLAEIHIDFMAFSTWKWLLGPLGLGVFYINRKSAAALKTVFKGTSSVTDDMQYLPYRDTLKPSAERFQFSTPSFIDWVWFRASLDFLAEAGFKAVQKSIHTRACHLQQSLLSAGLMADPHGDQVSGIVLFTPADLPAGEAVEKLKSENIIASPRKGRVRFSPHLCNSYEQLEKTVEICRRL